MTSPSGFEYKLIRSARKPLGIEIGKNGLVVRAPLIANEADICAFIEKHRLWIEKHIMTMNKYAEPVEKLNNAELRALGERALIVIPERVRYYAQIIGVAYGTITIRNQRSKWGSCSSKGNLNFNCLLMLMPPEVLDSVVVHELCHLKEMNHSPRFYVEVRKAFPDYDRCSKWLKEHGASIMRRMTGE